MKETVVEELSSSNIPQAQRGNDWLVLSKLPKGVDDGGRIVQRESLTIVYASKGYFNPCGVGTIRVKLARVPTNDDGSSLAATLGQCTSIGTAASVNRKFVEALADQAPDPAEVPDHFTITSTIEQLARIESFDRRRIETYSSRFGWESSLITTSDYGKVLFPKGDLGALIVVGEAVDDRLRFTHTLVDVLGTKHALMRKLGLDDAISLDQKTIKNSLAMLEANR